MLNNIKIQLVQIVQCKHFRAFFHVYEDNYKKKKIKYRHNCHNINLECKSKLHIYLIVSVCEMWQLCEHREHPEVASISKVKDTIRGQRDRGQVTEQGLGCQVLCRVVAGALILGGKFDSQVVIQGLS